MEKIKTFLTRRRLWFAWLAAVAVCVLALAWVRYDLAERVDGQPVYEIVNDDYSRMIEIPAASHTGEGGLTQTLELPAGQTLYGVRLNMATYNYAFATGTLHAELCSATGESLTAGTLPCIELRDNTFETVIFDTPYTAAAEETLTLRLWAEGFNEAEQSRPLGIWASEAQVGKMSLSDGDGFLDATAAIQYVVDYSGSWSGKILLVPAVLIIAAVAVGFWLLFGRKARPALAVLVCGGLLGAAFSVVTPPLVAPDEYTHLAVAYQYAGNLLGQPVTSEDGTLLVRACDEPYFSSQTGDIGIFAYKTMGENLTAPGGGISDTKTDISVDLTGRIWYLYLGQTAGIALARAMGLSFFAMLLLGRLGNLVLYLVLAALGVRLAAPNQRGLFAAVALLPMSLQLAGSLSADAPVLGMAFSYTALCFALRQQPARPVQLAALLILAACIGPAKAIYLPVVLLCLIIPAKHLVWREKDRERVLCLGGAQGIRVRPGTLVKALALVLALLFWVQANLGALLYATRDVDNVGLTRGAVALATAAVLLGVVYWNVRRRPRARRIFFVVLVLCVVAVVPVVLYRLTHMWGGLTPEQLVDSIQENGDSIYTFSAGYICRNVPATLKLLLRSVAEQGALWLQGILGTVLGEPIVYRVEVSWLLGVGLLGALAAASLPVADDENARLAPRTRLWTGLIALCVVGLTFFAALSWTPINYTTIFGVQGRYWLPVLPLALVLVHSNRSFCLCRSLGRGAVFAVVCLTSFVILQGYSLYASWQAVI